MEPGVGKWVSYLNREKKLDGLVGQRPLLPIAPKGIYLYGNVGSGTFLFYSVMSVNLICFNLNGLVINLTPVLTGKTMLMDMFYGATKGIVQHRKRFHFHEVNEKISTLIWAGAISENFK